MLSTWKMSSAVVPTFSTSPSPSSRSGFSGSSYWASSIATWVSFFSFTFSLVKVAVCEPKRLFTGGWLLLLLDEKFLLKLDVWAGTWKFGELLAKRGGGDGFEIPLKLLNLCWRERSGAEFVWLKVHSCRFENLPLCSCWHKNSALKILHS